MSNQTATVTDPAERAEQAAHELAAAGYELVRLAADVRLACERIAHQEALRDAALRQAGEPVPIGPPARALAADVLGTAVAPLMPYAVRFACADAGDRAARLLCEGPSE